MKVLLDIPDNQYNEILAIISTYKNIKLEKLTETEAQFVSELSESIRDVNLAIQGELKPKLARELLDEL
ncbi:MAG: hypothetical protein CVV25_10725 [Ignavibacteriae bacterium HGW-Ignavibacteriae-4]|jgi:hypothetical protein|nr:MAG: hypothetical protein CVV25_10725 [Ignavibacteriae bacterium HGW-Ignavibacteriae-4]